MEKSIEYILVLYPSDEQIRQIGGASDPVSGGLCKYRLAAVKGGVAG